MMSWFKINSAEKSFSKSHQFAEFGEKKESFSSDFIPFNIKNNPKKIEEFLKPFILEAEKKAQEKGYEEGFQKGYQEAQQFFEQEKRKMIFDFQQKLQAEMQEFLDQFRKNFLTHWEKTLSEFIQKLIMTLFNLPDNEILNLQIKAHLKPLIQAIDQSSIHIFVHPSTPLEDFKISGKNIIVQFDSNLSPGEFRLELPNGIIQTQWREFLQQLLEELNNYEIR